MQAYQKQLSKPTRPLLINKIVIDFIRNLATTRLIFTLFTFPFIKLVARISPKKTLKHTGARNKEMVTSLPKEWFQGFSSLQAEVGLSFLKEVDQGNQTRLGHVQEIKSCKYFIIQKSYNKSLLIDL